MPRRGNASGPQQPSPDSGFQTADRLAPGAATAPPAGPPTPPRPSSGPPSAPFPDGLDPRVKAAVESTGIRSLYPPQAEAVTALLAGGNVLVSIPTASGKSLIAHMGILHTLLARGGKALYIVPLRALATEKYEELRELTAAIGDPRLRVAIATGDLDEADAHLSRFDIIVTTSEKADSLIRHSAGWMREVSCVVADEVHLLGDSGRGPTLEVTLARLLALGEDVRLIALSATVGNADEIARWLGARLVTSTWRPVPLREAVYHKGILHFSDGGIRAVEGDAEPAERMVEATAREDAQALVFVNTRRSTEAVATKLGARLVRLLAERDRKVLEEAALRIEGEDGEASRLGQKLAAALRGGAAFHHAGLSSRQRRTVEDLFRARHVKAIVATPTLAAGVNLPARRVVVRDVWRFEDQGNVPLPVLEVKQMTGRAGRPRYDPYGESVLVAREEADVARLMATYLHGEPERISSGLGAEGALRIHLLAGIATGLTPGRKQVTAFIDSTFLARDPSYGGRWAIEERIDEVLRFLVDEGFVVATDDGDLAATRFGKRTSDLYIDPMSALAIREGLHHSRLVPQVDDLAVLVLVAGTPDIPTLWLRKNDDWVEAVADEHEGRWLRPAITDPHERELFLAELKTALLVDDWIQEQRLETLEVKYGLGPGDIHSRTNLIEWMLYAAEEIARLERPELVDRVKRLRQRVEYGVKPDLLTVIRALDGIGRYRGRVLAQAGLSSLAALKAAPVAKLLALPGFGPRLVEGMLKQLGRDADVAAVRKGRAAKSAAAATADDGKASAHDLPGPSVGRPEEDEEESKDDGGRQTRLSSFSG